MGMQMQMTKAELEKRIEVLERDREDLWAIISDLCNKLKVKITKKKR